MSSEKIRRMRSNADQKFFVLLLITTIITMMAMMPSLVSASSLSESLKSSSSSSNSFNIQELIERGTAGIGKNNIEITTFLDQLQEEERRQEQQQEQQKQQQQRQKERFLPEKEPLLGLFGERCDNNTKNSCSEELECSDISGSALMGNRCLPTTCLQKQTMAFHDAFDIEQFKSNLYNKSALTSENSNGIQITEDSILQALTIAKNEREFIQSKEFQSLQKSLHEIAHEPLEVMQQISRNCITTKQDDNNETNGTVSYVGFHMEAGVLLDGSLSYLIATNGDDQRTILRICVGAELGLGAELSYIFGFTNTAETENLLCGSAFADVDIVLLVAGGAAVGIGFNGVFTYEFTVGGGLGLGLGGGFCAGFEYGALNASVTSPPHLL